MTTLYSERLDADVHLGKTPAQPLRAGTTRYKEDLRPALVKAGLIPTIPEMFGHGHDFPQGAWKMLGNGPLGPNEGTMPESWTAARNGAGNCTRADAGHTIMEAQKNAGAEVSDITAEDAINAYIEVKEAMGGEPYDPETGEGDTGLDIQAVIEHDKTTGFLVAAEEKRHVLVDSIALEPGNVQHLWEMVFLAEKVKLGLVVTEAQMQQFDAHPQPTWDYVAGSPEVGGHDTPAVGKLGLLSWGEDVYYTPRFIEKQNDESFAVIHPEQFKAVTGEDFEGIGQVDLEKFLVEAAKLKLAVLR